MNLDKLQPEGFDWDKWNVEKNVIKHKVSPDESEEVFFNNPLVEKIPTTKEQREQRYYALGITDKGRNLTIIFTIRRKKIRVISARDMSRKERGHYERRIKKDSEI
ncbi:MAG: hypothetical protein COZ37_05810 [bacterium (Candidatus Ratteibacteria) CG_4_10_14_3_um_filter_41_18]|uniref:BrnT family toxin n=4 Tax=Candidatus Ratteibacteria TaxID=2979319 RepID=A0A2M7YI31_9BACT|nr:MAG: hypothetical protein AUJ76_00580 [Candidatus Omnitrophica bacterium CG1_02_41_171]PIV64143.1 MAG: hypothetical protein COS11_03715 [bacterium (Candidatus Ratteibacteria) CG01_land_8_20_14_3_00_40_19]PIW34172.1 MAG: hypothetical protein COW28_00665 [bacterium (Candidatus Ratteibacteria) CG15_BIG_FIL_POST_REV_8_21_14_020_41_12]PIW73721.1 MAG: hypothetical protein CO004_04455 [bacterium (Candidatus Ratteibacteria) CG_4_8_14_3_um_filter_41_36]PIX76834.1 MAG: hypothetical protein COZ37_05810